MGSNGPKKHSRKWIFRHCPIYEREDRPDHSRIGNQNNFKVLLEIEKWFGRETSAVSNNSSYIFHRRDVPLEAGGIN